MLNPNKSFTASRNLSTVDLNATSKRCSFFCNFDMMSSDEEEVLLLMLLLLLLLFFKLVISFSKPRMISFVNGLDFVCKIFSPFLSFSAIFCKLAISESFASTIDFAFNASILAVSNSFSNASFSFSSSLALDSNNSLFVCSTFNAFVASANFSERAMVSVCNAPTLFFNSSGPSSNNDADVHFPAFINARCNFSFSISFARTFSFARDNFASVERKRSSTASTETIFECNMSPLDADASKLFISCLKILIVCSFSSSFFFPFPFLPTPPGDFGNEFKFVFSNNAFFSSSSALFSPSFISKASSNFASTVFLSFLFPRKSATSISNSALTVSAFSNLLRNFSITSFSSLTLSSNSSPSSSITFFSRAACLVFKASNCSRSLSRSVSASSRASTSRFIIEGE
mmetsp:Transcript_3683/g.13117  ORF Transcript_3683/g.13117 Transcript_3683/m.13117 type:complete len:401 (-) Transcript_3683:216-1418(-)